MYSEDDLIPLSALQHLIFCERQCALIHIEQAWAENLFTAYCRPLDAFIDKPFTGAEKWIETSHFVVSARSQKSLPMRGRGLKPMMRKPMKRQGQVAPHAGAWIETDIFH